MVARKMRRDPQNSGQAYFHHRFRKAKYPGTRHHRISRAPRRKPTEQLHSARGLCDNRDIAAHPGAFRKASEQEGRGGSALRELPHTWLGGKATSTLRGGTGGSGHRGPPCPSAPARRGPPPRETGGGHRAPGSDPGSGAAGTVPVWTDGQTDGGRDGRAGCGAPAPPAVRCEGLGGLPRGAGHGGGVGAAAAPLPTSLRTRGRRAKTPRGKIARGGRKDEGGGGGRSRAPSPAAPLHRGVCQRGGGEGELIKHGGRVGGRARAAPLGAGGSDVTHMRG